MAVIEGGVSGALAGVGAENASPQHVAAYPVVHGAGGAYSAGMTSGTMAAALASAAEIFQFRYVTAASRVCLVHRVEFSAGALAAATAAGVVGFKMCAARGWSAAGSGGTRGTLTGNNAKLRTAYATSEVTDMGISTTAALTAGTKTLDTMDLAAIMIGIGTGAITVSVPLRLVPPGTALFDQAKQGNNPLVLASQEGFVIRTINAMPATMTWSFGVTVTWSEVPNF